MHVSRIAQAVVGLLLFAAAWGCSPLRSSPAAQDPKLLAQRQQQWWQENKHRATIEPRTGQHYIERVGYFDAAGQPVQPEVAPYSWLKDEPPADSSAPSPLAPSQLLSKGRSLFGVEKDPARARQIYNEGEELFRQRQYQAAIAKYKEAATYGPDSPLEEDAWFKWAECEFFSDRYPAANDAYTRLMKKYPSTSHRSLVSARRFALAQYWVALAADQPRSSLNPNFTDSKRPMFDTEGVALKTFESVAENDPKGELADTALMSVADAMYNKHRFGEADVRYQLVIKDYPHSRHLFQAFLRSVRCKLNLYQGPDYDGATLEDADDLITQMLTQFPEEVNPESRKSILEFRRDVRLKLAERDWVQAEYYTAHRDHRAARYYYDKIVREYSNTSFAQEAVARIEKHRGEPDVAPHPLSWAKRLLPGDEPSNETELK